MAETTATQRNSLAAFTMIFAARVMQDASPTDVPPNFMTCNDFFIWLFWRAGALLRPSPLHSIANGLPWLKSAPGSSIVRQERRLSPPCHYHDICYIRATRHR